MPDIQPTAVDGKIKIREAIMIHPVVGPVVKGIVALFWSWAMAFFSKEGGTGCMIFFYGVVAAMIWLFVSH